MKTDMVMRMLLRENREFVTSEELRDICKRLGINYESAIRHLVPRGYLVRVFRGIFYVKSLEENHLGKTRYSSRELVAKGLEMKCVKHWYFGLSTALVLNNMTHERFSVDYVLNDVIQRNRSMDIAGHEFIFKKIKPSLLDFGVINESVRYSDPEKTILDMVYIDRYGGVSPKRTKLNISEYLGDINSEKIRNYAESYPLSVSKFIEGVFHEL